MIELPPILPLTMVEPAPKRLRSYGLEFIELVVVPGKTLPLDFNLGQAFSIDVGALGKRAWFIFYIDNLPTTQVLIKIPILITNAKDYGIVGAWFQPPAWKGLGPARRGTETLYELRTWDGGLTIIDERKGYF